MALNDFTSRFGSLQAITTQLGKPIYEATDDELLAAIRAYIASLGGDPELAVGRFNEFVEMVKGYSVVIRRASLRDVLLTAAQTADPRISMILAAARDKNTNRHLFQSDNEDSSQTLDNVYSFMFGTSRAGGNFIPGFADTTGDGASSFYYTDLFVNGVRQVSAALTAAILIGRLSQVKEQADHARHIEAQALKDLGYITETYTSARDSASPTPTTAELDEAERANVAFYFQPGVIAVAPTERLVVGYYSMIDRQYKECEYTSGSVNVAQIVADLADLINSNYSIGQTSDTIFYNENTQAPFIATPSQSGQMFRGKRLITLSVYPRHAVDRVIAQALNVRIYVANRDWSGSTPPDRDFSQVPNSHPADATFNVQLNPADSQDPLRPPNQPTNVPSAANLPVADAIPDADLTTATVSTPLPYWGVNPDSLAQVNNNGILITIKADKLRAVSSSAGNDGKPPNVRFQDRPPIALYLRKKPELTSYPIYQEGSLTQIVRIRVAPRLDLEAAQNALINPAPPPLNIYEATISDRTIPGFITQSDVALAIIDALYLYQRDTSLTGIIFRNDDPQLDRTAGGDFDTPGEAITAMELLCWSPFADQTHSVLDILYLPPEFEMATGDVTTHWEESRTGTYVNPTNYVSFHTRWGPPPRSIKVDNSLLRSQVVDSTPVLSTSASAIPLLRSAKPKIDYAAIKTEHDAAQDYRFM